MQWARGGSWCIDQWSPLTHITTLGEHNYGLITLTMILLFGKILHWFYRKECPLIPREVADQISREFSARAWEEEIPDKGRLFETNWGSWVADVQIHECFQDSIMSSSINKRFNMEFVFLFGRKERLWHSTIF